MKKSFAIIGLLGGTLATVDAIAVPTISYVPNSLSQASIHRGPWVLHQNNEKEQYDASGTFPSFF
jgi:hypothetical protein